jgi:hypothetical protein
MATRTAGQLQPGHLVELKHGIQGVSHTIKYPPLTASSKHQFIDVFFIGQSYPLYFREDVEVEVVGMIDLTNPRAVAGVNR